ncbi:MAG: DUF4097 domain-containing protein [Ruminococcaceae bacterium]|nr:DUF4097 domain-containing protein [Oscillospiraceae bacterium]
MKYKSTVTVALTSFAIFFALAVAGGICTAAGFSDYAKNSGVVDSVKDFFDYLKDFRFTASDEDTEKANADYVRKLGSDVEKISVSTSGCSVDVRNGSEFSVTFSGSVTAGKFDDLDQTGGNKAVSAADAAADYDNSGIINASFTDGVLNISVESSKTFSIVGFGGSSVPGHVTVTLPDTYTGSFELNDCFAEVSVSGLDLDELALNSCFGEVEVRSCGADMLTVTGLMGEVEVDGSRIAGVNFDSITGEISLDNLCAFTVDSTISDVMGEVTIDLPAGTQLDVDQNDVLGVVSIDRAITNGAGTASLTVTDVVGEVNVEIDD